MNDKPGIGQSVTLWTTSEPPLFVSVFQVIEIPKEWFEQTITNRGIDLALLGNAHDFTLDFLNRAEHARCPFEISIDITDRYDPESIAPYLYSIVSVLTPALLWREDELVPVLILLQESPSKATVPFDAFAEYAPWRQAFYSIGGAGCPNDKNLSMLRRTDL